MTAAHRFLPKDLQDSRPGRQPKILGEVREKLSPGPGDPDWSFSGRGGHLYVQPYSEYRNLSKGLSLAFRIKQKSVTESTVGIQKSVSRISVGVFMLAAVKEF